MGPFFPPNQAELGVMNSALLIREVVLRVSRAWYISMLMPDGKQWEREAQKILREFLTCDLDLAFSYLETAALAVTTDRRERTINRAKQSLSVIRRLQGGIADQAIEAEIDNRANQLEADIKCIHNARLKIPQRIGLILRRRQRRFAIRTNTLPLWSMHSYTKPNRGWRA